MADAHAHDNHGKTPAAWAGSLICLVGAFIAAFGVFFDQRVVMIVGLAVCVAAALVGGLLSMSGKGSDVRKKKNKTRTRSA